MSQPRRRRLGCDLRELVPPHRSILAGPRPRQVGDRPTRRDDPSLRRADQAVRGGPCGQVPTAPTLLNDRVEAIAEQLTALEGRLTSVSDRAGQPAFRVGQRHRGAEQPPARRPGGRRDARRAPRHADPPGQEQARYQIAFREDLARLAEQLRRPDDPRRRRLTPRAQRQTRRLGRHRRHRRRGGVVERRRRRRRAASSAWPTRSAAWFDPFLVGAEVAVEAQLLVGGAQQLVGLGRAVRSGVPVPDDVESASPTSAARRRSGGSSRGRVVERRLVELATAGTWASDRSPMLASSPGNSSPSAPPSVVGTPSARRRSPSRTRTRSPRRPCPTPVRR